MKIWLIYFTAGSAAEARSIATSLVQKRLAACANILGSIRSVYRWRGTMEEGREVAALVKTSAGRVEEAISAIRKLHSYEVPCIVAWPLGKGHAPFVKWIMEETARSSPPRRKP